MYNQALLQEIALEHSPANLYWPSFAIKTYFEFQAFNESLLVHIKQL
jgi:hypothetical protein